MIAASQRKEGAIPACAGYGGGHQHPWNMNYMGKIPFSYATNDAGVPSDQKGILQGAFLLQVYINLKEGGIELVKSN